MMLLPIPPYTPGMVASQSKVKVGEGERVQVTMVVAQKLQSTFKWEVPVINHDGQTRRARATAPTHLRHQRSSSKPPQVSILSSLNLLGLTEDAWAYL